MILTNRARMDVVVNTAIRQGFKVWQRPDAVWMFRTGNIIVRCQETPQSWKQWQILLRDLIRVGLEWPPPERLG